MLVGPDGCRQDHGRGGCSPSAGASPSRDTDDDIETAEGRAIAEIFVDDGEDALPRAGGEAVRRGARRARRRARARRRSGARPGHPRRCWPGTRGVPRVGLSDAAKRVGLGHGRPLLLGNVRAPVKALLDERLPVYERSPPVVVDTDGRTPEEVADEVVELLEAAGMT